MDQVLTSTQDSSPRKSVRLILIEDSEADAFLVAEAARQLSYELHVHRFSTAARAINGIEEALKLAPHGVLLDLNLPGGSGLDVLRSIRNNALCRHLKVVVMTSSISTRDREAADALGIAGYLVKPSDFLQFVANLGAAIELICAAE